MSLEVSFDLDQNDYAQLRNYASFHVLGAIGPFKNLWFLLATFPLLLFGVIMLSMAEGRGRAVLKIPAEDILALVTVVGVLAVAAVIPVVLLLLLTKHPGRRAAPHCEGVIVERHRIVIDCEGIRDFTRDGQTERPWRQVLGVAADPKYIFIVSSVGRGYVIPKLAFSSVDEAARFESFAMSCWKADVAAQTERAKRLPWS